MKRFCIYSARQLLMVALIFMFLAMFLIAKPVLSDSISETQAEKLVQAAVYRSTLNVVYDGRYLSIKYPNGDVPSGIGVCTDLVIRSYRAMGIDLQRRVHEDISANFSLYPSQRIWGLEKPDTNIDHRRVPNLQVFFKRYGQALPLSINPKDYVAGDLVTWKLGGRLPHIGIVTDRINAITGNPEIVHNIGRGPEIQDMLFDHPIDGHYRYLPAL